MLPHQENTRIQVRVVMLPRFEAAKLKPAPCAKKGLKRFDQERVHYFEVKTAGIRVIENALCFDLVIALIVHMHSPFHLQIHGHWPWNFILVGYLLGVN